MTDVKDTEVLTQLGLTLNEAKIFLALSRNKVAETANRLSQLSGVRREVVYQLLPKLQEKGLIEKIISNPAFYKAVPIKNATTNLLKQKTKEQKQLRRQIQKLVVNMEKNVGSRTPKNRADSQFKIVPGKKFIIQKLIEANQKTQFSLDIITSPQRFSQAIIAFAESHQEALQRGVIIRIATQHHAVKIEARKILNTLCKNPGFEVRYFDESPSSIVAIMDQKEVFVILSDEADFEDAESLWSKHPSLVGLSKSYFQCKWKNSSVQNKPQKPTESAQISSPESIKLNLW